MREFDQTWRQIREEKRRHEKAMRTMDIVTWILAGVIVLLVIQGFNP
jgi:hypothetical protein